MAGKSCALCVLREAMDNSDLCFQCDAVETADGRERIDKRMKEEEKRK